jgi:Beta-lactamase
VTISASVSAAGFRAADDLMLCLMSMYNVPGTALALIKDGRIVLERGYGFRDLVTHAPVTTATLFNIGSISKSFTALGIAQLVDQHQVDQVGPGRPCPRLMRRVALSGFIACAMTAIGASRPLPRVPAKVL